MTYPLVLGLAGDGIPVTVTCRMLGFSTRAFYAWKADPVSERDLVDAYATNAAFAVHRDDPGFGYRFIADELADAGHTLFERYCPYGTADDVAEFLAPYATAGCAEFNLIPQAPDDDQAIAGAAAVKRLRAPQMTQSLVIPSRFCGPPGSGGYVCGRIATHVNGTAQSRCAGHRNWPHPWPSNGAATAHSASTTAAR